LRAIKAVLRLPAFAAVALIDVVERGFASSGAAYKLLLIPGFERLRWKIGIWRAWRSFYLAHRLVPAYRDYLAQAGGMPNIHLTKGLFPDLSVIPEMDKASYVKAYPVHERIKNGRLPRSGVMVDESSGSSGQPTSWVRGPTERQIVITSAKSRWPFGGTTSRKPPLRGRRSSAPSGGATSLRRRDNG